jgi:hypothetical protein
MLEAVALVLISGVCVPPPSLSEAAIWRAERPEFFFLVKLKREKGTGTSRFGLLWHIKQKQFPCKVSSLSFVQCFAHGPFIKAVSFSKVKNITDTNAI